jgi:hypothetical protein
MVLGLMGIYSKGLRLRRASAWSSGRSVNLGQSLSSMWRLCGEWRGIWLRRLISLGWRIALRWIRRRCRLRISSLASIIRLLGSVW